MKLEISKQNVVDMIREQAISGPCWSSLLLLQSNFMDQGAFDRILVVKKRQVLVAPALHRGWEDSCQTLKKTKGLISPEMFTMSGAVLKLVQCPLLTATEKHSLHLYCFFTWLSSWIKQYFMTIVLCIVSDNLHALAITETYL